MTANNPGPFSRRARKSQMPRLRYELVPGMIWMTILQHPHVQILMREARQDCGCGIKLVFQALLYTTDSTVTHIIVRLAGSNIELFFINESNEINKTLERIKHLREIKGRGCIPPAIVELCSLMPIYHGPCRLNWWVPPASIVFGWPVTYLGTVNQTHRIEHVCLSLGCMEHHAVHNVNVV